MAPSGANNAWERCVASGRRLASSVDMRVCGYRGDATDNAAPGCNVRNAVVLARPCDATAPRAETTTVAELVEDSARCSGHATVAAPVASGAGQRSRAACAATVAPTAAPAAVCSAPGTRSRWPAVPQACGDHTLLADRPKTCSARFLKRQP